MFKLQQRCWFEKHNMQPNQCNAYSRVNAIQQQQQQQQQQCMVVTHGIQAPSLMPYAGLLPGAESDTAFFLLRDCGDGSDTAPASG